MKLDKYTVGKRYGKALFELAAEEQQLDSVYQDLNSLKAIYAEIPDLGNMLSDVRLDLGEKRKVMDHIVQGFDNELVRNFLEVVYRYNRMDDLLLIIEEYDHRYDQQNGIVSGTVTTAVALQESQKAKLEAKLAQALGFETAHLTENVDESIMGGVIVEANHRVIDGSVKTRLEKIRARLSK